MQAGYLFTFLSAVNLIATLVAILPDAVVDIGLDIARHFHKVKCHAHLGILRVKGHGRYFSRARWANARGETAQTVFPTRPLANRELASVSKSGSAANMSSVLSIIEPLALVSPGSQVAIGVADVYQRRWVDVLAGGALVITAELELSVSLNHALWCSVVNIVIAEAESIAVFRIEHVAFA